MSKTFFISDTHFGHTNICKFTNYDGSPLRPWDIIEEHDAALIENWNRVVRQEDKVYHLGDCVIARRHLQVFKSLNGRKRLVRGNHDIFKTTEYLEHFDEIYGVRVLSDMILSHIPLAKECITARFHVNVHGHLHGNTMKDPAYFSVCCEQIEYTPIELEDLRARIKAHRESYGVTAETKNAEHTGPG
jgi:calcineurin-like phosphoesterase family protein